VGLYPVLAKAKVRFTNCEMDDTVCHGVDRRRCLFNRCLLTGSLFHEAKADRVDLSGSAIAAIQRIGGLPGVVIDQVQLLDLAEALASSAGLEVPQSS